MPNTTIGAADLEGVTQTVTPIVEGAGLVLEDVELAAGDPPVVRLVVDRPYGRCGTRLGSAQRRCRLRSRGHEPWRGA
jgi:ribosome maturation factor RimP